jgi:hypothetical protein
MAPALLRSAPCLPAALALISGLIAIAHTFAFMQEFSTRIRLVHTSYRPIHNCGYPYLQAQPLGNYLMSQWLLRIDQPNVLLVLRDEG